MYVSVLVDQSHSAIDRCFTYAVPKHLEANVVVGSRVKVAFAYNRKNIDGYILEINPSIENVDVSKIKEIKSCCDEKPILLENMIPLAKWIATRYYCPLIDAIKLFVRSAINQKIKTERVVSLLPNWQKKQEEKKQSITDGMQRVIDVLSEHSSLTVAKLKAAANVTTSPIQTLHKRGWVVYNQQAIYRTPWEETLLGRETSKQLTKEQAAVLEQLTNALNNCGQQFLLHGVTGSGKTEVYIQAIEQTLKRGRTAIVLVPEIALTPQTANRFRQRFGEKVALLHSALSFGEKRDEWTRIYNGQVDVVVGARSALFAPLKNVGMIIIDEAHEDSYKSDTAPRYHAIDVAKKRAELENAVLVLGSATPRVVDRYYAENNAITLLNMTKRVGKQVMPHVEVVDMREELAKGNRSVFSNELLKQLHQSISRNEQAILLMNRRGYASFVSCRSCGYVVKCYQCDVSMTYHGGEEKGLLICHYCGAQEIYPKQCPECGSKYIKHFGTGTQKVEQELYKYLPSAKVLRMDADTTSKKGAHQRMIEAFYKHEYDILLGTQMVAKGLDFPDVTLVGIMAADTFLNLPDYRSSERAFQLMTQAAGRAGRSHKSGRVVIQTYQPEHTAVQHAIQHDYLSFYEHEKTIRQQFGYPPFVELTRFLITGKDEKIVKECAQSINMIIAKAKNEGINSIITTGAYESTITRIKDEYRWNVLIKTTVNNEDSRLTELFGTLLKDNLKKMVKIALDTNPTMIL